LRLRRNSNPQFTLSLEAIQIFHIFIIFEKRQGRIG
jgi:hypothetical protein